MTHCRKNLLFITTDQQRWDQVSIQGQNGIKTPCLDRLAGESLRFRNMYTCAFPCSPSRATILTGLYTNAHGVPVISTIMPDHIPTLGTVLKENGYATAWVGKMHLGGAPTTKKAFGMDADPDELNDLHGKAEFEDLERELEEKVQTHFASLVEPEWVHSSKN